MSKTNIQVRRETRDALAKMGRKGDTYDDIIVRMIRLWEEVTKEEILD